MIQVRIIQAIKADDPYIVVGDVGALIELHAPAADWAVTQGYAVYTGHVPVVQREPLIPEERKVIDPRDLLGPEGQKEADEETPEPPKRPYGNQPKALWAEYAVAVDPELSLERALGMSKADLMSQYGERL